MQGYVSVHIIGAERHRTGQRVSNRLSQRQNWQIGLTVFITAVQ